MRILKALSWVGVVFLAAAPLAAQQRLETVEDTNKRLQQLAASAHTRPEDYIIGSSDLLKVDVFDVPDLSREVRVSDSGFISLPLIPVRIRAAGLTPFQLEQKLAELLQVNGLVSNPQVTVFVREHRSQPITVVGAVKNPTVYQAIRPTTLLEVISAAGGLADDAGSVVIVTRSRTEETTAADSDPGRDDDPPASSSVVIRLKDLMESGDTSYNIAVRGGDVVSVPRAGIVYVVGAVTRPGGFALQNEEDQLTALKALALAQGLSGTARPGDAVILRKNGSTGQRQEIAVNLNKIMSRKAPDVALYADDILFVPDSAGKKILRRTAEAALSITTGIVVFRGGR